MAEVKQVNVENPERFLREKKMTKEVLEAAFQDACKKVEQLYEDMKDGLAFPSHASKDNVYERDNNDDGWSQGFWLGLLWLCYEATGEEKYREMAEPYLESFYSRIKEKRGVAHHDMGFVFMPSCVAAYKLTGNEEAKEAAVLAAEHLMTRYHEKGGYIQAWGAVGEQLRLIVDCMNNIPLLYWASEVTGDSKYYDAALSHAKATMANIVREDASTYHTFYFNEDGSPSHGSTAQGASDDSCWSRGQSWIVSGIPLTYKYVKDDSVFPLFEKVTNYFLNHLPEDYVPFWDFNFTDGSGEKRDSSSAAIAACGILEMLPHMKDEKLKAIYEGAVDEMMYSLYENYSTKDVPESNGLLLHAVYSIPHGIGVDECNIWGCYYYMEALVRMLKGTKAYW
ncbi:MAG: glycoside hydrolase family 88 protein [Clostridia bacterium]|nr:glycoside hydrolase family 88 protein [Clostridia bacterium]